MTSGFVGTYPGENSGIYTFDINSSGIISNPRLIFQAKSSKYIICHDNILFAVYENCENAGVAALNPDGTLISSIFYEDSSSCHIAYDDGFIYTANYHEGTVTKLKFQDNQLFFERKIEIKEKAGCHQVIVSGEYLIIPCLLLDSIYILDKNLNTLSIVNLDEGAGPRHGVLSLDKKYLYILCELCNKLITYEIYGKTLTEINSLSVLPNDSSGTYDSAAIRQSLDGKTLYISTRTVNIITVVDISSVTPKIISITHAGGTHPRDILNVLDDKFLIVANRDSNDMISFDITKEIPQAVSEIAIPKPVSICIKN